MNRSAARVAWRVILLILIALTLVFIWSNSLENADDSTLKSDGVIGWLKPIVDPHDAIDDGIFTTVVRKCAHFSEFALLGAEVFLLLSTFETIFSKRLVRVPISGGACAFAAVTDEVIQLFSPGRACRVTDMMIDTAGSLFGALVICAVCALAAKFRRTQKKTA